MAGSPVNLAPGISGLPLSGSDYNSNLFLIENSFFDTGPWIISGLTISAGSGLSVQVSSGVAVIAAEKTLDAFAIGSLAPSQVNHLYLQQDGSGTSNLTGIAPARSVKLGTATTGATTVSSVNMGRTSGRQQFRQPQDLIPGGPAAGTTSAGHPASIDLSQWNATAAEGKTVFGVLPAGATSGGLTPPVTITLDDANQNTVQTVLTVGHTYNAGGGAAGIGVEQDFLVESSTNGTNKVAANLQATLTNLVPANATGKLSIGIIDNNVQVIPLTIASKDVRLEQAVAASSQHGLLSLGNGGFAGNFVGAGSGTFLAINAPSGFTGYLEAIQINGVSRWLVQDNAAFITGTPPGTANFGLFNVGDLLAHFDGSSSGHFTGSASGTQIAMNTASGFAGNLAHYQINGSNRYKQTATGDITATMLDATTNIISDSLLLDHVSTGTVAANWGHGIHLTGQSTTVTGRDMARIDAFWTTATDATRKSCLVLTAYDTAAREGFRIEGSGTASQISFYGGTAAIAKQTVTGSRGGNVALADLLLKLANLGLIVDGSS
jgi:hypothetical protein